MPYECHYPEWFQNVLNWVEIGKIGENQFIDIFNYLVEKGIVICMRVDVV